MITANSAFRHQFLHGDDPTGMSLGDLAGRVTAPGMLDRSVRRREFPRV